VYYFAGWWRELPNKYVVDNHDWRADFAGRGASLGEYNEQATMDREIEAAARHGVNFFQILWYPMNEGPPPERHAAKLNVAPELFMASPNNRLMKFTLEYVNHPPFTLPTAAAWETACRYWCRTMAHPGYLRVGGRPVFKIHGLRLFQKQCGGKAAAVADRIETLRRIARETGLPNPLISGGILSDDIPAGPDAAPYDFLTTYMEVPPLPRKDTLYPYETLAALARQAWAKAAKKCDRPYVPYVPAGWDPRPWRDPRPSFEMPTADEWAGILKAVRTTLDGNKNFGIPLPGGGRRKALLIYAWNEFGEGGIVAPTNGRGTLMLEGIRGEFGR
jgi:hypothetical protein